MHQFMRQAGRFYIAGMVFACFASFSDMLRPIVIARVIDRLAEGTLRSGDLVIGGILVAAVTLLSQALRYVYQVETIKGGEYFVQQMRDSIFSHTLHLPASWHNAHQTGELIQRCTMDVEGIKNFLSEQLIKLLTMLITIILALFFIASVSIKLMFAALISVPLLVGFSYLFYGGIAKAFLACDEEEAKMSVIAQENLTGVRVVRAFGRERYERDRFAEQNEIVTNKWIGLGKFLCAYWCTADVITGSVVMTFLALGSVLCVKGDFTVGQMTAAISYLIILVQPVRGMGRVLSEMSKAEVSIERIAEILNAPAECDDEDAGEVPIDRDIVFEHVSFAYEEGKEVLKDLSFTIRAGETLGILGNTGSGKTTIAGLIAGIDLPTEGRITIGGVDIRKIRKAWLRKNVALCMQEGFLFSRSIRDNICIGDREISETELQQAVETACLTETVSKFPEGLNTFVGERGVTLSGGQKQRTEIARALVRRSPVLVFDDSLSAVDAATDAQIRRKLKTYREDTTVIMISHRINTLKDADHILVLKNGMLQSEGTHEELMRQDGMYRQVAEIQFGKEASHDGRE